MFPLTDKEKVVEYEIHIEDILKALQERLLAFGNTESLSEFEQGRQLAYTEIADIIQTRHSMILDVIKETE